MIALVRTPALSIVAEASASFFCTLRSYGFAHSIPPLPALLDGDVKQAGQPALGIIPCPRAQFPEHLVLGLCPEWPRNVQHPSSPCREPHCPDPRVGVGHTFDETITLQKVEAARQGRLVDGQHSLELSQVRRAATRDGRERRRLEGSEPPYPRELPSLRRRFIIIDHDFGTIEQRIDLYRTEAYSLLLGGR